jgi:hypothetical protein
MANGEWRMVSLDGSRSAIRHSQSDADSTMVADHIPVIRLTGQPVARM